jgi:hypothetical protein
LYLPLFSSFDSVAVLNLRGAVWGEWMRTVEPHIGVMGYAFGVASLVSGVAIRAQIGAGYAATVCVILPCRVFRRGANGCMWWGWWL